MKKLLYFLVLLLSNYLIAQSGEVETIKVHDKVDMTWYGSYNETGNFPDGSKTYEQILMHYTMGCASGGCSDWDYTTKIELMKATGIMDSSVVALDTISTNPMVVDTTWNVFEVLEPFELARVITPYGGYMAQGSNGYDNSWEHTHTFDVTDFAMLLKDSVQIRAFYDGWSSGFSVTLDFEFTEGTPPRTVKNIQNIYKGSSNYTTSSEFESNYASAKTVDIPQDVVSAKMRIIPSGHGFDNNTNCAEFCQRRYYLSVNETEVADVLMWDEDCGENPIFPQGGTWLYDRANWCPGMPAIIYEHEITDELLIGESNTIDFDIQNITWSGNQAPYYILSAQLITYEASAPETDLALDKIIAPNDNENYARYNPICGNPVIEVSNKGTKAITRFIVEYGVETANFEPSACYYEWTGLLGLNATEQITLPRFEWFDVDLENPKFYAEVIEINNGFDDKRLNNRIETTFTAPPKLTANTKLQLRTNGSPNETEMRLYDENGEIVAEQTEFDSYTVYEYDWDLANGCYELEILDNTVSGGDGLSWWANNEGSGYVRLYDAQDNLIKTFNPDFGAFIRYNFTVGYNLGGRLEPNITCSDITNPDLVDPLLNSENNLVVENIKLYPNPSKGNITLEANGFEGGTISIFDIQGKLIFTQKAQTNNNINLNLNNGLYYVQLQKGTLQKSMPLTILNE